MALLITFSLVSFCYLARAQSLPTSTVSSNQSSSANSSSPPAITLPPVPTTILPSLGPEFNDIPKDVVDCWNSHANYSVTDNYVGQIYYSVHTFSPETLATPITQRGTFVFPVPNACVTTPYGLTTLCDGHPRATGYRMSCAVQTVTSTSIISTTIRTVELPWSSGIIKPSPTCTVAPDYGTLCSRLNEAWEWRTSQFLSTSPMPTWWDATSETLKTFSFEAPPCTVFVSNPTPSQHICKLTANYKAYYWPTAGPTGSDFCKANATGTPGTPTITGKPNTATVSGLTFTSPSAYHLFQDVTVDSFVGLRSRIGDIYPESVFAHSSPTSSPSILTVAQRESEILNEYIRCGGSGSHKHCVYYYKNDFNLNDLQTVRADKVLTNCGKCEGYTVYQNSYYPTVGIPLTEMARQNKVFTDCQFLPEEMANGWVITESESYGPVVTRHGPWSAISVTEPSVATTTMQTSVVASTASAGMSKETNASG